MMADKLVTNMPRRVLLYTLAVVGSEAACDDCEGFVDFYSSDPVKNPECSVSAPSAAPSVSGLHAWNPFIFFKKKSFVEAW